MRLGPMISTKHNPSQIIRKIYRTLRGQVKKRKRSGAVVRLPPRPRASRPMRYFAITAIAKNEGRYLREWIEFHRLMGAEQIYLYDNDSTDETAEIVAPYIAEGFLTFLPWTTFDERVSAQYHAYAHSLCNFGPEFRWMAFIDLDEFLFPVTAPNLPVALSEYDDYSSLCVPWFMFGFSRHESPPAGLVIENYLERAPFPPPHERRKLLNWKSIVDPFAVAIVDNCHIFTLAHGCRVIDERKLPLTGRAPQDPPRGDVFRINHYYTRSREEFWQKLNRKGPGVRPTHKTVLLGEMIEDERVIDRTILRFLPALRERMNFRREKGIRWDIDEIHRSG